MAVLDSTYCEYGPTPPLCGCVFPSRLQRFESFVRFNDLTHARHFIESYHSEENAPRKIIIPIPKCVMETKYSPVKLLAGFRIVYLYNWIWLNCGGGVRILIDCCTVDVILLVLRILSSPILIHFSYGNISSATIGRWMVFLSKFMRRYLLRVLIGPYSTVR